jgi:hypothetical protein
MGCERGKTGRPHPRLNVRVYDPATKTTMSWPTDDTSPKIVDVSRPQTVVPKQVTPEERTERLKLQKLIQRPSPAEIQVEQLGNRNFDGVPAEGTRTTRAVPAGEEGNEQSLVTTSEFWSARELGTTVMEIIGTSHVWMSTVELEDIQLAEPSASLFAPPAGYTLEEQSVEVVGSTGAPTR